MKTRAKNTLKAFGGAVLVLLSIMLIKAMTMRSRQPNPAPLTDAPVDSAKVAAHLAEAIRAKTISTTPEPAEFLKLHAHLEASYPKVHATLTKEMVGNLGLLYTWRPAKPGADDPNAKPLVLLSHQDVVPIEPGTESSWTHPGFEGVIESGFVWGRGTIDDKVGIICILEAVESLLEQGFTPSRTVYLGFGQDEEISGAEGAKRIAALLASRGVHAELVLDEGGPITRGIVPGIAGPVAVVGIAEKGYVSMDLSTKVHGGHSSTPALETSVTVMSRAVSRLQTTPMPSHLDGAMGRFIEYAGPEMTFGLKFLFANTWITSPILERALAGAPTTNAAIRTTTAVTMFHAGVKDNVLPAEAKAVVNFRVLPGDTSASVMEHIRRTVDDSRIEVSPQLFSLSEPGPTSSVEGPGFNAIATAIREVFPGTVVAPSLFIGATDGRLYAGITENIYRFVPISMDSVDIGRIHGKDERVSVAALGDAVRFYRRLIQLSAGPSSSH